MKPTKAQEWVLTQLPVQATLDRYGTLIESLGASGRSTGIARGIRLASLDGLVARKLAKKTTLDERRWRYDAVKSWNEVIQDELQRKKESEE